jgi:hypothetical protein
MAIIEIKLLAKKGSLGRTINDLFSDLNERKMKITTMGLKSFFGVILDFGSSKNEDQIKRAVNMFDSISKSLKGVSEIVKHLSLLFLSLGLSFVMIAGGLLLAGKMLGTTPLGALGIIAISIAVIGGMMIGLAFLSKYVKEGEKTVEGMGKALLYLSGGLLAFVISIQLVASIMNVGNDALSLLTAVGIIALIVIGAVGLFTIIGLAAKWVEKGNDVVKGMAWGMILLAGGILALALVGKVISLIAGVGETEEDKSGFFGKYGPMLKTLGAMGLILLACAGFFALLGIPVVAILIGAGVAIGLGMAWAMNSLAVAVKTMVNTAKELEGTNVKDLITKLTGAVIGGIIDGVGGALTGGKTGMEGFHNALKRTAILFAAVGILMSLSMALSKFASALSAFANLGNMRVIKEYKSNGDPVFGPTIDIAQVGQNIAQTLGTFFTTLMTTFKDPNIIPNKEKMQEIVDILMGNTGFRILGIPMIGGSPGLLDAISKFADIIKTFAKVNQIPIYDNTGKITSYVGPNVVASNIVSTLSTFFKEFSSKIPNISAASSENAEKLAQILLGQEATRVFGLKFGKDKPGILEPIMKFAEMLKLIGGNPNKISYTDDKGKVTEVDISDAAANIVNSLSTFSTAIAKALESKNFDTDTTKKAIEKIKDIIDAFDDLTKMQTGLEKVAGTIGMLAQNIGLLSSNLKDLDAGKINAISEVGNKRLQANIKGEDEYLSKSAKNISNPNVKNTNIYNTSNTSNVTNEQRAMAQQQNEQIDWDRISTLIGKQVAAALRSSQFKFEFATNNSGVLSIRP